MLKTGRSLPIPSKYPSNTTMQKDSFILVSDRLWPVTLLTYGPDQPTADHTRCQYSLSGALLPASMHSGSWDFVQKITKTLMPAYYVRSITAMPLVAVVLPGWNCITWLRDRSVDGAIYSTYGVSSAKSCHGSLSVCCPCLAWERT
jgi:hypothetical protein